MSIHLDLPVFTVEDRAEGVIIRDQKGLPCTSWQIQELYKFCEKYLASYSDAEISRERSILLNQREVEQSDSSGCKRQRNVSPGYVYLAKAESLNRWKIGRSKRLIQRGKELQKQSPVPLIVEWVIKSIDYKALEASLHSQFNCKRLHGEWFELTPSDVDVIKSIKPDINT